MKFAFIIDPVAQLDPTHDSSVAMMEAAQMLGHEVWTTYLHQLSIIEGRAYANLQSIFLEPVKLVNGHWQKVDHWFKFSESKLLPLDFFDGVFMRKDPPVTVSYLYATYILDCIDTSKTKVINSPQGIRSANEKIYALNFPSVTPETIVTQSKSVIAEFLEKKGKAVIKPLGGKAGEGILFLQEGDRNFNSLIEISTKQAQEPVMVQEYLPAAKEGDKRIIMVNGKPLGAVNRIPTGKEFRGNMAVGGTVAKTEITPRDLEICNAVAPQLIADGLFFVGIDVIGDYLTEVNVTSPTGIREIDRLNDVNLGKQVIESVKDL